MLLHGLNVTLYAKFLASSPLHGKKILEVALIIQQELIKFTYNFWPIPHSFHVRIP
jgi:hypothetical protein